MKSKDKYNPASLQNRFCYTGEELRDYHDGKVSPEKRVAMIRHLNIEKCQRCRDMFFLLNSADKTTSPPRPGSDFPDTLASDMQKYLKKPPSPTPITARHQVEKGQIWTTSPYPRTIQGQAFEPVGVTVPVLIVDPAIKDKKLTNVIRVMPLTFDTGYHCHGETFLLDSSGPTGFSCLVEIFNERPMLAGNLSRYKCSLAKDDMKKIETLLEKYRSPDGDDAACKDGADSEISNRDRKAWRKKEFALCDYLTDPVNQSLQDEVHRVAIAPYRKAADDGGPVQVTSAVELMNNDFGRLLLLQKKDQMLLRFSSHRFIPRKILVDDRLMEIKKTLSDEEFEVEIGRVELLRAPIKISLTVNDQSFDFTIALDFPEWHFLDAPQKDTDSPLNENGSMKRNDDDNR